MPRRRWPPPSSFSPFPTTRSPASLPILPPMRRSALTRPCSTCPDCWTAGHWRHYPRPARGWDRSIHFKPYPTRWPPRSACSAPMPASKGTPRALEAGDRLAGAMGMTAIRLSSGGKPAYHAGAVMAANYTVALAGVAERLAVEGGVSREVAEQLYLPLIRGAVNNLEHGPVAALTGPIRRGDLRTVEAHLSALALERPRAVPAAWAGRPPARPGGRPGSCHCGPGRGRAHPPGLGETFSSHHP